MSNAVLRLAIVDPNDQAREELKNSLLGLDHVWLEAECSRYEFFSDVVEQTDPDIGLIGLDSDPEKAIVLVKEVKEKAPNCAILVSSSSTDGNLILQAMRAGVKEFLTHPLQIEDLVAALDRVSQERFGDAGGRSRGSTVLTVVGATGGVGQTSIAVNMACVLAADERNSVVLIDLDLSLGDVDVFLDAIPEYSLYDVTQNVARLDINLLKRSLTKHASGLYLLPRPMQLDDIDQVRAEDFERVIGLLKATFSHVIVDTSKGFTACDQVALKAADEIVLLTQLDLPCLRNIVRLMMHFDQHEGMRERVKVVVNRSGRSSGNISLKKAEETIGAEVFRQLPNDYETMVEVRNNGVPLIEHAPRAAVTQKIVELTASLIGEEITTDDANAKLSGVGRLFALWPARGKGEPGEPE